jgi:hypothetical protein
MVGAGVKRGTLPHSFIGRTGRKFSRVKILFGSFSGQPEDAFFRAERAVQKTSRVAVEKKYVRQSF